MQEEKDWSSVRDLFDAAIQLAAADRAAFVEASGASAEVRQEVLSLIAHAVDETAEGGAFLARPAAAVAAPGLRLGPWALKELLGTGGMGEVWLAQRADGAYEGEAAVKMLKRGLDSEAVLKRFAQERQALARLDHPNIARLYDAGISPHGLPYFVMERVRGRSIDQACLGLDLNQRLELFLQLADAVAHAHRHLLVHRDLKPGNVLVSETGQVKLLDFGIAKALDPLEGDGGDVTQAGQRPFTPSHASPEQIRGQAVSTATDVYSLGVLLYQLLTGQRPYGRDLQSPVELAQAVLHEQPTRPSSLSAPAPEVAAEWLSTRQHLKGDLDNILLKTLEKEPAQRYSSVEALADDLRAHLAGYPVSARPPTAGYLLARFVSRNKLAVGLSGMALLLLLAGLAGTLWQMHVAQTAHALAERRFADVHRFARTMLFDVDKALADGPTAGREKLVTTSLHYLDRLSQERLQDEGLLRDVAEGYERIGDILGNTMQSNLGRPDDARQALEKSLAVREALARRAPQDLKNIQGLKSTHERLGDTQRDAGELEAARRHYEQAARHAATLQAKQPDVLRHRLLRVEADRYLASVDYWPFNPSLNRYAAARPVIERLDREMDAILLEHPKDPVVLEAYGGLLNQLSDFQRIAGEFDASLRTQRKGTELARRLLGLAPDNPRYQRWLYLAEGRLADALIETGSVDEGLQQWDASIARRAALAASDPGNERAQRNLANGYGPLAEQLDILGRPAQALQWVRQEHALLKQLRGKFPQVAALGPRLDESQRDLALQLALNGQLAQARTLQRELQARRKTGGNAELDAKFLLASARVSLLTGMAADKHALQTDVLDALDQLEKTSLTEPFNALLAREAALGALIQGMAWLAHDPEWACKRIEKGLQGLDALNRSARLPKSLHWRLDQGRLGAQRCQSKS